MFSESEVAAANEAIDKNMSTVRERKEKSLRNTRDDTTLAGDGVSGRQDLGGILSWEKPFCDPFRRVLCDPRLLPYYHTLLGPGYRMDHQPFVIVQNRGSEGFHMHGGSIDCASGRYNPSLAYECRQGDMHMPLLGVSVQLSDHNAGDGGFMIVRGSHKSNFAMPSAMIDGEAYKEHIYQPVTRAGDVVIFCEGTVHGAMAWNADFQRRVALYRFSPAHIAYGRAYTPGWPEENFKGASDAEAAVLEPPYNPRIDRPVLEDDGSVSVQKRNAEKKQHDTAVHGTEYF